MRRIIEFFSKDWIDLTFEGDRSGYIRLNGWFICVCLIFLFLILRAWA